MGDGGRAAVVALALVWSMGAASAADKVTFGTNWLAEAEHGGFYQAVVDGTYAKYGLDVTILQGGPQANNLLLLPTGKIDFYMGDNMISAFNAVDQKVPIEAVSAIFQKDPQIVMSHPGVGLDTFESLTKSPIFVSKEALASFFAWMKAAYGFSEELVKPYTFNAGPFLADKSSVMQGYLTSEPFEVERQGGFKPNVFLLADHGFSTYATTIMARLASVSEHPDMVQRFVDASAVGWYNYLYGDNKQANEAIKHDNPDMTDEQIAFSIAKLKEYGVVDSGDTKTLGIGAMTDARQKDFFDKMVNAKVIAADLDYKKAYTLQFVDKKIGLELGPK